MPDPSLIEENPPVAESAAAASLFDLAITGGLQEGAKLRAQRMIQVTGKGIRFLGEPNFEQYQELVRGWKMVREAWDVGLADIHSYGVKHFGEETVQQLFAQSGFDFADEMRARRLGQMTLDMRLSSALTNDHFYVLGGLELPKERSRWMALAEKHGLTPRELQKSIAAGRVMKDSEMNTQQGTGSGMVTIQGIRFYFDRWEKKVGGEQQILALPLEQKRQLMEELEKPGELYLKLKTELKLTEEA